MGSFSIVRYSFDALKDLLVEGSHSSNEEVRAKSHVAYLDGYLVEIGARTIVAEHDYVDRDFLEDFAAYHVRCFADYERACTRLHFFGLEFDQARLEAWLLQQEPADEMQDAYLGFVVVKPLPRTIVGRSCLATYPSNPTGRHRVFPTVREEKANLFGIPLTVRSIPFQEQDQDVAACASSALWTVLHGTSKLFQHATPSPVEITRAAGLYLRLESRHFPAGDGLTSSQMADAIRSIGLEPLAVGATRTEILQIATLAYLQLGIPGLLAGKLCSTPPGQPETELGGHAIAVVGYGRPDGVTGGSLPTGQRFKALAVDRLYCHDDQLGPFAKLTFGADGLTTPAPHGGKYTFKPTLFLIPIYHKIRISAMRVFDSTAGDDVILEELRSLGLLPIRERVTWDIRLSTVNELRGDLAASSSLDDVSKYRLLTRSYPKFVWRVEAASDGVPIFEAILDATDLLQGQHLVDVIPYDKPLCRAIEAALSPLAPTLALRSSKNPYVDWLIRNNQYLA